MDSVRALFIKKREIPASIILPFHILTFTLLITLGAFVYIPLPFTPVPITMQVLFVLLAGLMLGARAGTLSVFLYILAGALGIPVFAGALGGFARILGPTGGYLLGFLISPCIVVFVFRKLNRGLFALVFSLFAGLFAIYCCGMLHLSLLLHLSFGTALKVGVYPFILGDILKIILVLYVVQFTRRSSWSLFSSFQK